MRVFLLPGNAGSSRRVVIRDEQFRYLSRVLRLGPGGQFRGTDGAGRLWRCTIERMGPDSLEARLEEPTAAPAVGARLSLLQVLPKGRKMDAIVRQATEAGVWRIVPLLARHSFYRFRGEEDVTAKLSRWRRVAREAVQQSGRARVPVVEAPRPLREAVGAAAPGELRLLFHQERRGRRTLHECLAGRPESVTLLVGPEGGMAEEEVDLLVSLGFLPVTVGQTVLRTETAALYALAAVQTILQEREAWQPVC
jgi:16S rRNA (uracil1498-N3)-methyltransferase